MGQLKMFENVKGSRRISDVSSNTKGSRKLRRTLQVVGGIDERNGCPQ